MALVKVKEEDRMKVLSSFFVTPHPSAKYTSLSDTYLTHRIKLF
jgi:hypothetical protein